MHVSQAVWVQLRASPTGAVLAGSPRVAHASPGPPATISLTSTGSNTRAESWLPMLLPPLTLIPTRSSPATLPLFALHNRGSNHRRDCVQTTFLDRQSLRDYNGCYASDGMIGLPVPLLEYSLVFLR